jgi:hypothetical protein
MTAEDAQSKPHKPTTPTTQQREQREDLERHKRETLNALIGEQVLHTLGRPGDLFKVQVRPLWGNYYRVNVLVGADVTSVKVANSFFLSADGDGNIGPSTPKMTQQY